MILRRTGWVRRAVDDSPIHVNDPLTARPAKRRHRKHEIDAAMVRRMLRAYGRTVAEGDPSDLVDLLELVPLLDAIIGDAAAHMKEHSEFTWQTLADAAGLRTRQAAQQRWGRKG